MRSSWILGLGFVLFAGCDASQDGDLGRVNFNDAESLSAPGSGSFAVGDELVFVARPIATSEHPLSASQLSSSDPAVFFFSGSPEVIDGDIIIRGAAVGEGSAALILSDPVTGALLDQITLQAKNATGLSFGAPTFAVELALPDPAGFTVLSTSDAVFSSRLLSGLEGLKGQILGAASVDPQFVSTAASLRFGDLVTLSGHALGTTPIFFSSNSFSQRFDVSVVAPDSVALSVSLSPDDGQTLSSGQLRADAVFLDGSGSLFGEQYRFQEKGCIVNLTGSCHVEFDVFGDVAFFTAVRTGSITLQVSLKASDGHALQSVEFPLDVFAD